MTEEASSTIDEEFSYLNGEDDDYSNLDDEQDYDQTDGPTSTVRRLHHDSLNDQNYQSSKNKNSADQMYATMPRRSGRKVVKKEWKILGFKKVLSWGNNTLLTAWFYIDWFKISSMELSFRELCFFYAFRLTCTIGVNFKY